MFHGLPARPPCPQLTETLPAAPGAAGRGSPLGVDARARRSAARTNNSTKPFAHPVHCPTRLRPRGHGRVGLPPRLRRGGAGIAPRQHGRRSESKGRKHRPCKAEATTIPHGAVLSRALLLHATHWFRFLLCFWHIDLADLVEFVHQRSAWQSCTVCLQVHDRQCPFTVLLLLPCGAGEAMRRYVGGRALDFHGLLPRLLRRHSRLRLLSQKLASHPRRSLCAIRLHGPLRPLLPSCGHGARHGATVDWLLVVTRVVVASPCCVSYLHLVSRSVALSCL